MAKERAEKAVEMVEKAGEGATRSCAMTQLIEILRYGTIDGAQIAAGVVRNVAMTQNIRTNMSDALEPLVQILITGSPEAKEAAAGAIANLTFSHEDNQLKAVTAGAIEPLQQMLETGASTVKEVAASALQKLATVSRESKIAMLKALPTMLSVITQPGTTDYTAERMVGAISSMLGDELVVETAVESGAISTLVDLLHRGTPACKEISARCLASISVFGEGFEASVGGGGAIIPLVRMLQSPHPGGKEAAAGALCVMSRTCVNNKNEIGNTRAITYLIDILADADGNKGRGGLQVAASSALANLALGHPDNAMKIAKAGALMPLVALLEAGPPEQLEDVVQALASITAATEGATATQICKELISLGVATPLVKLLAVKSVEGRGAKLAASIMIQNFTAGIECESNVVLLLQEGAVPLLLQNLIEGDAEMRESAAGALSNMTVQNPELVETLSSLLGAYAGIIEAVKEGSLVGRANAAGIILNIAYQNTARSIELKDAGAVQALGDLLRNGDVYGKAAAATALHNFAYEKEQNLMVVADAIGLPMTSHYLTVTERLEVLKHSMCDVSSDSQSESEDSD